MATWTEIFPDVDGSPINGDPEEFVRAGAFFEDLEEIAQTIHDEFDKLKAAGVDELQGAAATAFIGVVEDVKGSLKELPRVAGEAGGLLSGHVTDLNRLKGLADEGSMSALARARVHWTDRATENSNYLREASNTNYYQRQLDGMAPDDPALSSTTTSRNRSASRRDSAARAVGTQDQALAAIRTEWTDLRNEEDSLSETLDQAIDDIKLASLSDPGRLDKLVSGAFDLVLILTPFDEIWDFASSFTEALIKGFSGEGWGDFLFLLSDALGAVLTVLAVVALLTTGPLGLLFLTIVAVVAVTKMVVDTYLYGSKTVDPRTGKPMSGLTYGINMVGSALSLAGAGATGLNQSVTAMSQAGTAARPASSLKYGAEQFAPYTSTLSTAVSRSGNTVTTLTNGYNTHANATDGRSGQSFYSPIIPQGMPDRNYSVVVNGAGAGDALDASGWNASSMPDFTFEIPDFSSVNATGFTPSTVPFDYDYPVPVIIPVDVPIGVGPR